jgi:hypothetical protein
MSARFQVDLLHPGRVPQAWHSWFTGPKGLKRLMVSALGGVALLLIILGAMLPSYWRLSHDLSAVPILRRDLTARETDLGLLRSNLGALAEEARRQVRWAELLQTLSQQIPPTLKLQLVEVTRPATSGEQTGTPGGSEGLLRIQAVTSLRPGSPPLLDTAQFMAGLMRDPAVNKRFQLKSWELKAAPAGPGDATQLLNISIVLSERAR